MGLIKWNEYYSVKVDEIDNQHKKLIDLINQMFDAMKAGKGKEVMGDVLSELVEYTKYHFATEEGLLRQAGYPELKEHHMIHEELTRRTNNLKTEFDKGNDPVTMDVMLFLSNWLNVHILEVDKRYVEYLTAAGVK
jgi:hemerythrin